MLGSTNGTDLQAIIDEKIKDVTISFILSNKKDAYILQRAKEHGIKAIYLDPQGLTREEYDVKIDFLLKENNVGLVLLIGYMRFMSPWFVKKWLNQVMNIHPSLLPAFAGGMDKNVHAQVLKSGIKETGATLMFIDDGADTGPIIMQQAVKVADNETVDTLKNKVQTVEKLLLIKGIELYRDGKIQVKDNQVIIE